VWCGNLVSHPTNAHNPRGFADRVNFSETLCLHAQAYKEITSVECVASLYIKKNQFQRPYKMKHVLKLINIRLWKHKKEKETFKNSSTRRMKEKKSAKE